VKNKFNELLDVIGARTPAEARDKLLYIMNNIRLETNLLKLGIDNNGIEIIIKNGFSPQRMKNNPKAVSKNDLRKMLRNIQ